MAKTPQTAAKTPEAEPTAPAAAPTAAPVTRATTLPPSQVQFDTSQLKSSYCNVTNGTSTREEVVLNFGLNDSWDMGNERLKVHLQHRIVMSPHAAKRLRDMMVRLIDEHEKRHGPLGE